MHPKERYEEIITGKLAALPLPDMADAIWLRIERQLDIDMPTDEGGDVPEPPSPWNGGGGLVFGAGLLTVIGAMLIAFFYFKPNKQQPNDDITVNNQTTILQSSTPEEIVIATPAKQNATPQKANKPTAANEPWESFPDEPVAKTDDIVAAPDSAKTTADNSMAMVTSTQTLLQPEIKQDTIQKKKRGLQNVDDKDYRIVPKNNNTP